MKVRFLPRSPLFFLDQQLTGGLHAGLKRRFCTVPNFVPTLDCAMPLVAGLKRLMKFSVARSRTALADWERERARGTESPYPHGLNANVSVPRQGFSCQTVWHLCSRSHRLFAQATQHLQIGFRPTPGWRIHPRRSGRKMARSRGGKHWRRMFHCRAPVTSTHPAKARTSSSASSCA